MKVQFNEFALRVGKQSSETRLASEPLHAAYKGATAEQQADLRVRWMTNHVAGQIIGSATKEEKKPNAAAAMNAAQKIITRGKGKGSSKDGRMMIDRAYSDFRYHIVRPSGAKPEQARTKVPAAIRAAAIAFIAEFEGKNRNAQIDAAIATLRAMKS
jgi:hypothetical protein